MKGVEKLSLEIGVRRLRTGTRLPEYATSGAAGLDLHACLEEPMKVPAGEISLIPTGLALAIPSGYVGLIRDRSSLAVAGLHTVAGVIDSDYRGEVKIAVHNGGDAALEIRPGDRVAQLLVLPCPQAQVVEMAELPQTPRGTGGFGSTGR